MRENLKRPIITLIVILLSLAIAVGATRLINDNDTDKPTEEATTEQTDDKDEQSEEEAAKAAEAEKYKYTAQRGDSYTTIARKAIQAYSTEKEANITEPAIIFAETNLTRDAGSPLLENGQTVQISVDALASIVEKAKNLTESQQAAWGKYVKYVNFNTEHVGQAAK